MPLPPLIAGLILVIVSAGAALAPWIAPHGANEANFSQALLPPAWMAGGQGRYFLGTDSFGRDILSRILHGAKYDLLVALMTIVLAAAVGTAVAVVAGYFGGFVDNLLMRVTDIMLSLPLILIALVLVAISKPSFGNVIFILALFLWTQFARQIRAEVLVLRDQPFVVLARVAGRSHIAIMARHILPNIMNTLLVLVTLQVGWVILLESSLSFLGVGLPPPTPAWGLMVADGRDVLDSAWWVSLFPGLAIAITVLAVNMLGDWLRDFLDPRTRVL